MYQRRVGVLRLELLCFARLCVLVVLPRLQQVWLYDAQVPLLAYPSVRRIHAEDFRVLPDEFYRVQLIDP